jgi:pyridoxine 5-phosphate synthase
MTRLSVNINKVALIRNSRKGNLPDLLQVAKDCERFGAEGITVHPRPDERHIRYSDIPRLKEVVTTEFNIEGYPSDKFMKLVLDNKPDQCTLVPDGPNVLTSDCGWDTIAEKTQLQEVIQSLKSAGIRVSLFVNAEVQHVEGAKSVGADRIELYTGDYANEFDKDPELAVLAHRACAQLADQIDIGLNSGHDLNLINLTWYRQQLPNLLEVSIGHALVSDALYYGFENIIPMYKRKLKL